MSSTCSALYRFLVKDWMLHKIKLGDDKSEALLCDNDIDGNLTKDIIDHHYSCIRLTISATYKILCSITKLINLFFPFRNHFLYVYY